MGVWKGLRTPMGLCGGLPQGLCVIIPIPIPYLGPKGDNGEIGDPGSISAVGGGRIIHFPCSLKQMRFGRTGVLSSETRVWMRRSCVEDGSRQLSGFKEEDVHIFDVCMRPPPGLS